MPQRYPYYNEMLTRKEVRDKIEKLKKNYCRWGDLRCLADVERLEKYLEGYVSGDCYIKDGKCVIRKGTVRRFVRLHGEKAAVMAIYDTHAKIESEDEAAEVIRKFRMRRR